LVQHAAGTDSERALRCATAGLPVAALAVFAIFVAPGGLATNAIFTLGETTVCLAGFCSVARGFAMAVFLQLVVATFGPGVVGVALASAAAATTGESGTRT
jgi:Na+/proline symporter